MAECRPVCDFTFLPGDLRGMMLHLPEAQHQQELGSDGDEERNSLLVHGADVDSNGFSATGVRVLFIL